MYISPHSHRPSRNTWTLQSGSIPVLAFIAYALLAAAGTLLLSARGFAVPQMCMESIDAACFAP